MIVNIQGNLIDTKKIWKIGEIFHSNELCFRIAFLNNNSIIITKSFIDGKNTHDEQEKLERAREKLIEYWNSSKLPIPEIII